MDQTATTRRFNGVRFLYLCEDHRETCDMTGTVELGGGRCVLIIPGGYGPYLIDGTDTGGWYAGQNTDHRGNPADAMWARVGDVFVGVWREDNLEWLFSFRLPAH